MHEVPLSIYIEYAKLMLEKDIPDEQRGMRAIELLCGLQPEHAAQMPVKQRDEILETIKGMAGRTYRLQQTFHHEGIEYGFHPIIDELTLGEFVDARKYAGDPEHLDRFMAIFYRPITSRKRSRYSIEKYEGTEKHREVMLQQSAALYLGVDGFFLHIASVLMSSTLSSGRMQRRSKTLRKHLPKNGATIPS